jgi:hypothetical protein
MLLYMHAYCDSGHYTYLHLAFTLCMWHLSKAYFRCSISHKGAMVVLVL